MKKNNKKIVEWLIPSFLSVLTIITIMLFAIAQKRYDVVIENINGNNYITDITIGQTTYYVKDFAKKYNIELIDNNNDYLYDDSLLLKDNQKMSFTVTPFHNINIIFDKSESSGELLIKYRNDKNIINFDDESAPEKFVYTNSMYDLIINYAKGLNNSGYFLFIILFILFTIIYNMLVNKMINIMIHIKNNSDIKITSIILIFLTYFIINIMCMLPLIEFMNKWYSLIIFLQILFIVIYFKDNMMNKLHNVFVVLTVILTVNMAILLPPFHVPDEFAHFIKSYSLFNQKDILNKEKTQIKIYDDTYNSIIKYTYDLHNSGYRTTIKEYFADMSVFATGEKNTVITFDNTADINPFAYIPSAIIVKLILAIGLPFMLAPLLGRIINALVFILLGYIALKKIPYFKKILFMVMLFPITIQQVTAINQDSLTLSIIFLFIGIVFDLIYRKENILLKDKILILIVSICLGLCKPGYFPLTLIVLLIPSDKLDLGKKSKFIKILPFVICATLTFSTYLFKLSASQDIDNLVTYGYALSHPIFVLKLFINTLYQRGTLDLLTGQLNLFGWSTIYYDYSISFIICCLYFVMLILNNEKSDKLKLSDKLMVLIVSTLIFGLIYVSAMVGFKTTFIYSTTINGLQSRYFIPVTLLLLIGTSNDAITLKVKNINFVTCLLISFTFLVSFYTIISGFYL